MKFRLYYRGPLKSNGNPKDKQKLRRAFHSQLKDLWTRSPLVHQAQDFLNPEYELSVVKKVDRWTFTSIINETHHLIADLNITILRPEEPGSLITQGGDIDNRLKTLLDALTIPKSNQIPRGDSAGDDEQPCHCLLEDDNLITGLNVTVDRLLRSGASDPDPSEVLMMICVDVSATRGTLENLELSI